MQCSATRQDTGKYGIWGTLGSSLWARSREVGSCLMRVGCPRAGVLAVALEEDRWAMPVRKQGSSGRSLGQRGGGLWEAMRASCKCAKSKLAKDNRFD